MTKELVSNHSRLEEWRHILEGTKHMIKILNDHQNLTLLQESQNLELPASMLVPLPIQV